MHQVRIEMEFSTGRRLAEVAAALRDLEGVRLLRTPRLGETVALVTVDSTDPDYVEIVRELCWEFDPAAVQRAIEVEGSEQLSA